MHVQRLGLALALAGLMLTGCAGSETTASGSEAQPSAQPATAWWKTEGQEAAVSHAVGLQGAALASWTKLASLDATAAVSGAKLFDAKGCAACHSVGGGAKVGPDLQGITHRVEPDWLDRWLTNPDPMLETDPYAKAMLTKYMVKMPNLQLKPDEIHQLVEYFRQQDLAAEAAAKGAHS